MNYFFQESTELKQFGALVISEISLEQSLSCMSIIEILALITSNSLVRAVCGALLHLTNQIPEIKEESEDEDEDEDKQEGVNSKLIDLQTQKILDLVKINSIEREELKDLKTKLLLENC